MRWAAAAGAVVLATPLLASAHAPASAAPASTGLVFTGAPGRVTIGFGPDRSAIGDGDQSATDRVAPLSGGGVLLADGGQFGQAGAVDLVALRADGALNKGFGAAGLAQLPAPGSLEQLAGEPDGGALLLLVNDSGNGPFPLALLRVDANGAPDSAFAAGGTDRPAGLDGPAAMALAPDGSIAIASTTAANSPQSRVVVTRLTAAGAPDPTFDGGHSVTLPTSGQSAAGIALAPDGDMIVLGSPGIIAALTPSGALDPAFDKGAPISLPSSAAAAQSGSGAQQLLVSPAGIMEVLEGPLQQTPAPEAVTAYLPAGTIDTGFGSGGAVTLALSPNAGGPGNSFAEPTLLPASGAGTLVVVPTAGASPQFIRLTAGGQPDPSLGGANGRQVDLGFGHGDYGQGNGEGADFGETAAESSAGTIFLPGVTEFAFYTGAGSGEANDYVAHDAVAALTPALQADTAFGAGSPSLRMGVRLSTLGSGALRVRLVPSQASEVGVRVTARGTIVARGGPILLYAEPPSEHRLTLSSAGARLLRAGRRLHVTVSVTATALDGQTRTFHAAATVG
jgi:hypothetical protein